MKQGVTRLDQCSSTVMPQVLVIFIHGDHWPIITVNADKLKWNVCTCTHLTWCTSCLMWLVIVFAVTSFHLGDFVQVCVSFECQIFNLSDRNVCCGLISLTFKWHTWLLTEKRGQCTKGRALFFKPTLSNRETLEWTHTASPWVSPNEADS